MPEPTGAFVTTPEALLDDLHRALHKLMQQDACSPDFCPIREDARRIMREATERGLALRERREQVASSEAGESRAAEHARHYPQHQAWLEQDDPRGDPFVSSCACCCSACEDLDEASEVEA